jgi:hypothetical protein
MNPKILKIFTAAAAIIMLFVMFDTANAQRRREVRGRGLTKAQVKVIINRVEDRVDNFVERYDKSLDRSKLDGTTREDQLNKLARSLERATDELSREFDRRDAWAENRSEVQACLRIASEIDRSVRNRRFGKETEANWARVRYELNSLADVYNIPKVGARVYR